jgi:hypothetical protein
MDSNPVLVQPEEFLRTCLTAPYSLLAGVDDESATTLEWKKVCPTLAEVSNCHKRGFLKSGC